MKLSDRTRHASEGAGTGPVGGGTPQHDPDPGQRPDRGRGQSGLASAPPTLTSKLSGPRTRHGRTRRGDHGFGGDAARNHPQTAGRSAGQPDRRRRLGPADHHGGPVDLQPGDPPEGRLSGDGKQRVFLELLCPRAGPAAAVRQGEVRDFDRRNPLLPERRLYARRQGENAAQSCAASPPMATALARIDAPLPEAPTACPA